MRVIEISCQDVWREISNYVDDNADSELKARMEAHFRLCRHCTAVLDGTRNVVKLAGGGMLLEMPEGFSHRLLEKLRRA